MPRIRPLDDHEVAGPVREEFARQRAAHERVTNLKRTLAHSPVALRALMEWYALRDVVRPFLGERLTHVFAHAISAESDCLICSTYFRRILIEAGEDPDALSLDERGQAVVAFARQLATDARHVSDELYATLSHEFSPEQIVSLTAFGALMVATNVFINALRVDLDGYLVPYTAAATRSSAERGSNKGR